jgi:hypothetical protein
MLLLVFFTGKDNNIFYNRVVDMIEIKIFGKEVGICNNYKFLIFDWLISK